MLLGFLLFEGQFVHGGHYVHLTVNELLVVALTMGLAWTDGTGRAAQCRSLHSLFDHTQGLFW